MAVGVVLLAGATLRILAARGDLWLDEIWSLELARLAGSAGGVFTGVHHDNNHHLNTLWLLLLGPSPGPLAHRGLAVLAGTGTLAAMALSPPALGLRRPQVLAWTTLAAFSPILVQYGSEARGYGPAILFATAGFVALDRLQATGRRSWAVAFVLSAVLGLLSHLTFLFALLGFGAWVAATWWAEPAPRRPRPLTLAALAVPALAFAVLWRVDLRHLQIGGGPEYRVPEVLRELLRHTLGLPRGLPELLGLVAVAGAASEVLRMARERRPEWAFFVVVLVAGPWAVVAWKRPEFLAPRYFVVAVPFFLLLVGLSLVRQGRRGPWGRWLVGATLAVFLGGSALQVGRLLRHGRGAYLEAVEFIVRNSPAGDPTVGSDHDFRNPAVLGYYAARVPGGAALRYLPPDAWAAHAPLWFLAHDLDEEARAPPRMIAPQGRPYRLVRVFPYAGLSGWHWQLYRREDAP